jgi:hypothetical protein
MIDPVTALAAATTAFKAVQSLVNTGREIEDVAGQLGKWFTAVSDIREAEAQAKNPPLFKKLVFSQSVEEEALNALIAKKKAEEQETQIREMIMYRYGMNALREMYAMRRQIKEAREKAVYRRQQLLKNIQDGIIITLLLATGIGAIWLFIYLLTTKGNT